MDSNNDVLLPDNPTTFICVCDKCSLAANCGPYAEIALVSNLRDSCQQTYQRRPVSEVRRGVKAVLQCYFVHSLSLMPTRQGER